MEAYLILEDGTVFAGRPVGARQEVIAEIVFNTSMTGYLEVLTDPSYAGQTIVMTYPLIGNYGVSRRDMESEVPAAKGWITRELSRLPSSWRAEDTIQQFLEKHRISGITGVDTRALTRHLRSRGTMNGCITTRKYRREEMAALLQRIRSYRIEHAVDGVSTKRSYCLRPAGETRCRVAVLDLGLKQNILQSLLRRGCEVQVFPADTSAEEILKERPDGILLTNGPGDPKDNPERIRQIRILMDSGTPLFAICLGHQLAALAAGGDTYKLKYGHRGGNHPVKNLATGRVYISAQNHGYAVDADSLDPSVAAESYRNVNDGTNEGLVYAGRPVRTVQFHPEAKPGPVDTAFLFDEFVEMMEKNHA